MKPLIYFLAFFFTILTISIQAQRNNMVSPPFGYTPLDDTNKSDNSPQELKRPDTLNDNNQLLLKENYKLPAKDYINFARTDDGKTYTGTKNGIIMYDGSSNIRISIENSNIPENNITALARDRDDHLWIGTYSSGIVIGIGDCIKPFKIKVVKTHDQNILAISSDGKGLVWVTFRNGGIECFLNGVSYAYFPKQ